MIKIVHIYIWPNIICIKFNCQNLTQVISHCRKQELQQKQSTYQDIFHIDTEVLPADILDLKKIQKTNNEEYASN